MARSATAAAVDRDYAPGQPTGAFRALVGEADWRHLPPAVRRRFGRDLAPGESAVYVGEVAATELTVVGWLWAQLARGFGAPLPLKALAHTASVVVVTADTVADTQLWTRIYHETRQLPQVIRSMKSFSGSTGREERQGRFSITLTVMHPWFGRIIHQVAFFRDAC